MRQSIRRMVWGGSLVVGGALLGCDTSGSSEGGTEQTAMTTAGGAGRAANLVGHGLGLSGSTGMAAAASSTRMPSGTTSLPMPSPGMTAIR